MLSYRIKGIVVLVALLQMFWCTVWGGLVWWTSGSRLAGFLPGVGMGTPVDRGAAWKAAQGEGADVLTGVMFWILPWIVGIAWEAFGRVQWHGFGGCLGRSGGRMDGREAARRTLWPVGCAVLFWAGLPGGREGLPGGGLFSLGAWGGVWLLHRSLPGLLRGLFFSQAHRQRAVLVGGKTRVREVASALRRYEGVGVDPVGWVGQEAGPEEGGGVPWLGRYQELDAVLEKYAAQQIVLVDSVEAAEAAESALELCQQRGIRLLAARTACAGIGLPLHWESGASVDFGSVLREPLQSPWNRFLKRMLDLAVAVPAVCCAVLPMACVVWVGMRFQSPGPVFHCQMRHGRNNRPFRIWKFRTMHCGNFSQAKQATRGDARIFPLGAWLRRHSLDELPQFLNVLRGEMSTVGPRPHLVEHTEIFGRAKGYHWRSYVKPGITGWAQVNGCRGEVRTGEDVRRRVEWDVRYVENWSLLMDLRIVFQTFRAVISPPETAF